MMHTICIIPSPDGGGLFFVFSQYFNTNAPIVTKLSVPSPTAILHIMSKAKLWGLDRSAKMMLLWRHVPGF